MAWSDSTVFIVSSRCPSVDAAPADRLLLLLLLLLQALARPLWRMWWRGTAGSAWWRSTPAMSAQQPASRGASQTWLRCSPCWTVRGGHPGAASIVRGHGACCATVSQEIVSCSSMHYCSVQVTGQYAAAGCAAQPTKCSACGSPFHNTRPACSLPLPQVRAARPASCWTSLMGRHTALRATAQSPHS
jgi:hypothetical protein